MTHGIKRQNFLSKVTLGKPRLPFSSSSIETVNNIAMDFFLKTKKTKKIQHTHLKLFKTCLSAGGKSETNRITLIRGYSNSQNILNSHNSIPNYFNNRTDYFHNRTALPCCAVMIPCQKNCISICMWSITYLAVALYFITCSVCMEVIGILKKEKKKINL